MTSGTSHHMQPCGTVQRQKGDVTPTARGVAYAAGTRQSFLLQHLLPARVMVLQEDKPLDKPELTEKALAACGISYDAEVYEEVGSKNLSTDLELPKHVDNVRKMLLAINQTIHPDWKEKFLVRGFQIPPGYESAWLQHTGKTAVSSADKKREAMAEIVTTKSIRTAELFETLDNSEEREWSQVMVNKLYKQFVHTKTVTVEERANEWRLAQDLHWNEFSRWKNMDPERQDLTGPKPDITYGFPIYHADLSLPPAIQETDWAQLFAYGPLRELHRQTGGKLRSAPNTKLNSQSTRSVKDLRSCHLLCFPWAVVELKHAQVPLSEASFCYRQAANATAAALDIQLAVWNAAHQHLDEDKQLGVPPIVAFTCVGSKVKVWLTYSKPDTTNSKHMRCIYETDVSQPWGVLSISTIIQNMKNWAFGSLRNRIVTCLNFINSRRRYSESMPGHRINLGGKNLRIVLPEACDAAALTSPINAPAAFAGPEPEEEPRTSRSESKMVLVRRARKSDSSVPPHSMNKDITRSAAESSNNTSEPTNEPGQISRATTHLSEGATGLPKHKSTNSGKLTEGDNMGKVKQGNIGEDDKSEDEDGDESRNEYTDESEEESKVEVENRSEGDSEDESEDEDDNTCVGEDESGDEDEDNKQEILDQGESKKKIGMSATAEHVTDIKQRALEVLDGTAFTKLPTFKTIIDSSSNEDLRLTIELCLFEDGITKAKAHLRNELKVSQWDTAHSKELAKVRKYLNSTYGFYDDVRVTMNGGKQQPNIIKYALQSLSTSNKSRELKRILINLLSCYTGKDILKVLKEQLLVVYDDEWAKLANEALDEIQHAEPASYRQYTKAMKELSAKSRRIL